MKRRRLILVATAGIAAAAVAVWLYSGQLTQKERRLVGTWGWRNETLFGASQYMETIELRLDRTVILTNHFWRESTFAARWFVNDGHLYLDYESNAVRRGLRPLLARVGVAVAAPEPIDGSGFDLDDTATDDGPKWHRVV